MELTKEKMTKILEIYEEYVKEAVSIENINRWATKKSITETLLASDRANETKVVDAIKDIDYQIGDKVYLYSAIDGMKEKMSKGKVVTLKSTGKPKMIENKILKRVELFDGDYDKWHYTKRVYDTIKILENVIDMDKIINYNLKKNRELIIIPKTYQSKK